MSDLANNNESDNGGHKNQASALFRSMETLTTLVFIPKLTEN